MNKISYTIKLLIVIAYLFCMNNISYAGGLPLPDFYAEACITSTNLIPSITLKCIEIRYFIDSDETVFVKAHYELYNSSEINLTQEVCLPFFTQPLSMNLIINDHAEIPQWKYKNISYYMDNSYFTDSSRNSLTMEMISIVKDIYFLPKETKKIELLYNRKILSNKYNNSEIVSTLNRQFITNDISKDYFYKCVYIARTGYAWKNPINDVTVSFSVHKYLLNQKKFFTNLTSINDYSPGYLGNTKYTYDVMISRTENNDFITLAFNYNNWLPKFDLGINWIVPYEERNFIYYVFKNYWYHMFSLFILFLIIIVKVKKISISRIIREYDNNKFQ